MRFPFFASSVLITIFCFVLMIKSFDYGQGWAIALSAVFLLFFGILSLLSLLYEMRQHDAKQSGSHH